MTVTELSDAAVLANESINVARDYIFDEDAVLAKFTEEKILQEDLIQQAAARIIRRLNAVMKNK